MSKSLKWNKIFVFWGDERYVNYTDNESNFKMADETLLSKVDIPAENIYRMPVEISPIRKAAAQYEKTLKEVFIKLNPDNKMPVFDLIILGIGNDGHTASLFPENKALNEKKKWAVSVKGDPALSVRERITLTLPVINSARNIMFIISGKGKGGIIKNILSNNPESRAYPASFVKPEGKTIWFIDKNIY